MSVSKNYRTQQAIQYHQETKHSLRSIREESHRLDWDNKPHPFKEYENRPIIQLPTEVADSDCDAASVLDGSIAEEPEVVDRQFLSRLCQYGAGVTRVRERPGGKKHYFRAAACAGALYPTELYLHVSRSEDERVPPGLYHFHPKDRALRRLRGGSWSEHLAAITRESTVLSSDLQLLISSIPWRSSWKYRARAYRHLFWDSGTILANIFSLARAGGFDPLLVDGFLDEKLNDFLGIDSTREFGIGMVVFRSDRVDEELENQTIQSVPTIDFEVRPLSKNPRQYELIQKAYEYSKLVDTEDLKRWGEDVTIEEPPGDDTIISVDALDSEKVRTDSIESVIRRRGSSRKLRREPVKSTELNFILRKSLSGVQTDFGKTEGFQLIDVYLIANAVEGLDSGGYYFDPQRGFVQIMTAVEEETRDQAGQICLGQRLAADAACVIFTLTPLEPVIDGLGNRGYRAAQHEGGVFLGKVNLLTYAQKLASTGITFFDDQVMDYFLPHSEGKTPITAMCVGKEGNREELR